MMIHLISDVIFDAKILEFAKKGNNRVLKICEHFVENTLVCYVSTQVPVKKLKMKQLKCCAAPVALLINYPYQIQKFLEEGMRIKVPKSIRHGYPGLSRKILELHYAYHYILVISVYESDVFEMSNSD